jgi:hypothetical protein
MAQRCRSFFIKVVSACKVGEIHHRRFERNQSSSKRHFPHPDFWRVSADAFRLNIVPHGTFPDLVLHCALNSTQLSAVRETAGLSFRRSAALRSSANPSKVPSAEGALRRRPPKGTACSDQQARHFDMVCSAMLFGTPTLDGPNQRRRREHAAIALTFPPHCSNTRTAAG